MKQLIIFLILCIPLFGQIKKEIPNGYFWSDSLYQTHIDTIGTDDTTAASLTSSIALGFNYDWFNLVAIDTGATFKDTIAVESGTIIYEPASGGTYQNAVPSDTIWTSVTFVRDSTWTNTNGILTNDNAQSPFTIWVSDVNLLRLRYANSNDGTGTDTSCVWKFYGTFNKKK